MSTAVAENQQLLPQLFQSLNMMSSTITNLQAEMQLLNTAHQPGATSNAPRVQFAQPPTPQPPVQPYVQQVPQQQAQAFYAPTAVSAPQQAYQKHYQQPAYNNHGRGRGGGRGRGHQNRTNVQNAQQTPRAAQPKYYCWSHGMCSHAGQSCSSPMQGHQYHATFQNRMNGSARGCQRYGG